MDYLLVLGAIEDAQCREILEALANNGIPAATIVRLPDADIAAEDASPEEAHMLNLRFVDLGEIPVYDQEGRPVMVNARDVRGVIMTVAAWTQPRSVMDSSHFAKELERRIVHPSGWIEVA